MATTHSDSHAESVEDRKQILEQDDHMRGMEQIEMTVLRLDQPVPSVTRVVGQIQPVDPTAWVPPNQAVRILVETPEGVRPVMRIYTIRRFDPETCQVEIDFVRHEDDSPAMRWLAAARPGTRVGMIGPRQHFLPPQIAGKRAAIFADETAIPAVYAILAAWPEGGLGDVWVETWDEAAFAELPRPEGVGLHLLLRTVSQPAGTAQRLLAAARAIATPADCTVWAAGERVEMRDLRGHFQKAGVARDHMQVIGYWKLGLSGSDLDRVRLAEYEALRESGKTLEELDDMDLPV